MLSGGVWSTVISGGGSGSGFIETGPFTVTEGVAAANVGSESADGTVYTSVVYQVEITRGTTIMQTGEFAMQYRNGTWYLVLDQFLTDTNTDHGVTFSISQTSTTGTLQAAATSGPGNATLKLKKVRYAA